MLRGGFTGSLSWPDSLKFDPEVNNHPKRGRFASMVKPYFSHGKWFFYFTIIYSSNHTKLFLNLKSKWYSSRRKKDFCKLMHISCGENAKLLKRFASRFGSVFPKRTTYSRKDNKSRGWKEVRKRVCSLRGVRLKLKCEGILAIVDVHHMVSYSPPFIRIRLSFQYCQQYNDPRPTPHITNTYVHSPSALVKIAVSLASHEY